jgi:hypothetical protein
VISLGIKKNKGLRFCLECLKRRGRKLGDNNFVE